MPAALLVALLSSLTASATKAHGGPDYERLVAAYGAGDREVAVAAVSGWADKRLAAEVGAFVRSRGPSTVSRRAALLLHTEAALRERSLGRSPHAQVAAAQEIAGSLRDHVAQRRFLARWHLVLALDAQGRLALDEALDWAERGLRETSDDQDLRLVIASVQEASAGLTPTSAPDGVFEGRAERWQPDLADPSRRTRLEQARAVLREVLRKAPGLAEAHLRLGRVSWRLGDTSEARTALRSALAADPSPAQAYLAHLCRGRPRAGKAAR